MFFPWQDFSRQQLHSVLATVLGYYFFLITEFLSNKFENDALRVALTRKLDNLFRLVA